MTMETEVKDDFLDRAILALASGGPVPLRTVGKIGPCDLVTGEDRDRWATRVVDDALALSSRRELKLLECEAEDVLARKERGRARARQSVHRSYYGIDGDGNCTRCGKKSEGVSLHPCHRILVPDTDDAPTDCPKCEGERAKTDALDSDLTTLITERDALRAEIAALKAAPPAAVPAVFVTDCEGSAQEIGRAVDDGEPVTHEYLLAVLAKHTAQADVAALAEAIDRKQDSREYQEASDDEALLLTVRYAIEALGMGARAEAGPFVDVVFDGPPSHESGRFVECEEPDGRSVKAGEWIDRKNGLWALRIPLRAAPPAAPTDEALHRAFHEFRRWLEAEYVGNPFDNIRRKLDALLEDAGYVHQDRGEQLIEAKLARIVPLEAAPPAAARVSVKLPTDLAAILRRSYETEPCGVYDAFGAVALKVVELVRSACVEVEGDEKNTGEPAPVHKEGSVAPVCRAESTATPQVSKEGAGARPVSQAAPHETTLAPSAPSLSPATAKGEDAKPPCLACHKPRAECKCEFGPMRRVIPGTEIDDPAPAAEAKRDDEAASRSARTGPALPVDAPGDPAKAVDESKVDRPAARGACAHEWTQMQRSMADHVASVVMHTIDVTLRAADSDALCTAIVRAAPLFVSPQHASGVSVSDEDICKAMCDAYHESNIYCRLWSQLEGHERETMLLGARAARRLLCPDAQKGGA